MADYKTVTVPADSEDGIKSGVTVQAGDVFTVAGSGRASYGRGQVTYPDGTRYSDGKPSGAYMQPVATLTGAPHGMLIARIGSGPWLVVGASQTMCAQEGGDVIVAYNDRPGSYGDNSGEYTVVVENHGAVS